MLIRKRLTIGSTVNNANLMNQGLVMYYQFNEMAGSSILNSVNNKYHCTLKNMSNTATSGRVGGLFGAAIAFDGTDDYISMPTNDLGWINSSSFTISFWLKSRDSFATTAYIMSRGFLEASGVHGMDISISSNTVSWMRNTGQGGTYRESNSVSTYSASGWNHFVLVYDKVNATRRHYVNGLPVTVTYPNSADSSLDITYNASYDSGWSMGALRRNVADAYGKQFMAEIRIYNRPLYLQEVQMLFAHPFQDYNNVLRAPKLYSTFNNRYLSFGSMSG